MHLPMVPLPVPSGVQPWVTWIFVAIALGAFVLILINGIRRLRRNERRDDDPPQDGDQGTKQP